MPRRRHTRRQVLQLGAAAAAGSALRPLSAHAASCGAAFEMGLDEGAGARAAGGWRTTRVYRAPRRFDLVGLRWPRGARVEAQVRARRRNGRWTPWVPLHPAGEHAPDRGRAAAGSEPVFTGAADLFQLRLRGNGRGLRARFVRALPDARRAGRRGIRARSSRARQVAPGGPSIIPRADWGGNSCPPRVDPSYGEIHLAFVHHTVTANDYGPEDSAGIVLGICRYHRDHNGWNDVGYNFLVDKYGQIFEGRSGGIDQAVIGAQAQGYNGTSTGVSVLGDYTALPLSDAGLDALASLLSWKLGIHGVPVEGQVTVTSAGGPSNRYRSGTAVTFERISGHRDGNNTACPGELLYGQLDDLRARTAGRAAPSSRVTLRVETSRVRYPSAARLSGSLRFADGASPAGLAVVVEHSADGVSFSRLGSAVTDFEGRWTASIELPSSGRLRARYGGDAAHPPMESPLVAVKLIPKMTLSRRPVRARYGRWVRYEGTFEPQPASSQLTVQVERRNRRGRWRRVERERISVIDGSFSGRVRVERPGLYRLVVKGPGGTVRRSFRALGAGGRASRRRGRGTGGTRARG